MLTINDSSYAAKENQFFDVWTENRLRKCLGYRYIQVNFLIYFLIIIITYLFIMFIVIPNEDYKHFCHVFSVNIKIPNVGAILWT